MDERSPTERIQMNIPNESHRDHRFYANAPRVSWEEFRETLRPNCECGKRADAIHFLENGVHDAYPRDPETTVAVFSCPDHDWGGYWVSLKWFERDGIDHWMKHLSHKIWRGDEALARVP